MTEIETPRISAKIQLFSSIVNKVSASIVTLLIFVAVPFSFVRAQTNHVSLPLNWQAQVADWNDDENFGVILLSAFPLRHEGLRQSLRLDRLVWDDVHASFRNQVSRVPIEICGATVFQATNLVDFIDASPGSAFVVLRVTSLPLTASSNQGVESLIFGELDKEDNTLEILNCQ